MLGRLEILRPLGLRSFFAKMNRYTWIGSTVAKGGKTVLKIGTLIVLSITALSLVFPLCSTGLCEESLFDILLEAARRGQVNRVRVILDRGVAVDEKTEGEVTALMVASVNGQVEVVKVLIERGADVNARNKRGITPLLAAVMSGSEAVVKELLAKGADINIKDHDGDGVLVWSTRVGNAKITDLLRAHGAK